MSRRSGRTRGLVVPGQSYVYELLAQHWAGAIKNQEIRSQLEATGITLISTFPMQKRTTVGKWHVDRCPSENITSFSLVSTGVIRRFLRRLGILHSAHRLRTAFVCLGFVYLPLVMLSGIDGTAWGNKVQIALLHDFSVYARFLIGLPLLIAAEPIIDQLAQQAASTLNSSGIIRQDEIPAFHAALERIVHLRDSIPVVILLGILSLLPYFLFFADYQWLSSEVSTWHGSMQKGLTLAGWWFALAASPFLRFLIFEWLWRGILWGLFLWKVSKLNLELLPTHPDRVGGLGFLLHVQEQFGVLAMALGSVVAGQFANEIFHFGGTYKAMTAPMGVFVALSVLIILLPLTFFSPQLFKARYQGLHRYSVAGRKITHKFDTKWVRQVGPPPESMIGTQDPSSLIDYISSYDVISKTRLVPITRHAVMYIAALAAAPFALVWLLATPLERVVEEIVKRML